MSYVEPKDGEMINIYCSHYKCTRKLKGQVIYASTLECVIPSMGYRYFDPRNMSWTCFLHVGRRCRPNHHRKVNRKRKEALLDLRIQKQYKRLSDR